MSSPAKAIHLDEEAGGHSHSHSHGNGHHDHSKCGDHGHSHGGHSHGPSKDDGHGHDHSKCGGHGHSHDGGHGHSHDDGHGHSHGGGGFSRGPSKQWFTKHSIQVKLFVYGMVFAVWYVTVFWLGSVLSRDSFDAVGNQVFFTIMLIMSMASYYKCSTTRNGNPTKTVPVHASAQNNSLCKTCNNWKPERTHHCRACGECVLRMDHHCPWVGNCVGYRNHKAFVLFCLYMGFGSLYYVYRAIYYTVVRMNDGTFWDIGFGVLLLWSVFNLIVVPVGLMVLGLGIFHVTLAMNNLTTLESLGSANMKTICDSKEKREKKLVHKFDKGMLANLFEFFGNTYFFWWWPTVPPYYYPAQFSDSIGTPTPTEILDMLRGKTNEESPEERLMKPRSLAEVDVENIFKIAEEFTKDKHLQFFNVMLEVGKRRDNTYVAPVEQVSQTISSEVKETNAIPDTEGEAVHANGI